MHICKIHIFNYVSVHTCTHTQTYWQIHTDTYLCMFASKLKKKVSLALKKPSGVAINHLFKKNFIIISFEALVDVNQQVYVEKIYNCEYKCYLEKLNTEWGKN